MLSPIFAALFMVLAFFFAPKILKHRKILTYGVWGVLALEIILRNAPFMAPFVKGFIGYALFFVVAITGALPPKWTLTKKLFSVRGMYSILGFVLLTAHPIFYTSEILTGTREIPWYGVISYVVMIPLWITSYLSVRKKMTPQNWKKLQRFAYVSYVLMFVHLIVNASTPQNRIVAIAMAAIYGILKLIHTFIWRKQK